MALGYICLILTIKFEITVMMVENVVLICIDPSFPILEEVSHMKILQEPLPC